MKSEKPTVFSCMYLQEQKEKEKEGNRWKTYVARIPVRVGMRLKISRKWMYRCRAAGRDVDDRGRRMRAVLVSLGFSMHAECTGGETLFTSYANVGNSADWNPSMRFGCNAS